MPSRDALFRIEALEGRLYLSAEGPMPMEPPAVPEGTASDAPAILEHYGGRAPESEEFRYEPAIDALFEGSTAPENYKEQDTASPKLHAFAEPLDGATITVNSALDTDSRDAQITLREALLISNGTLSLGALTDAEKAQVSGTPSVGAREKIRFSIDSGPQTIFVSGTPLPTISDPVIIDGTTQPGFDLTARIPIVAINASGGGVNASGFRAAGLEITSGNSIIQGLIFNESPSHGIRILGGSGNKIFGNLIGSFLPNASDLSGDFGNREGILIRDSSDNQIGGSGPGEGNVISGNRYTGLIISGSASVGNRVYGNFIGTDPTGKQKLPNGLQGVLITGLFAAGRLRSGKDRSRHWRDRRRRHHPAHSARK